MPVWWRVCDYDKALEVAVPCGDRGAYLNVPNAPLCF